MAFKSKFACTFQSEWLGQSGSMRMRKSAEEGPGCSQKSLNTVMSPYSLVFTSTRSESMFPSLLSSTEQKKRWRCFTVLFQVFVSQTCRSTGSLLFSRL